jgi:UDP-N-acetylglucosamine:LPS N-acetylglucosamine transferase
MVTILTDIADYPPHFWIEEKQDQHFICGSAKAVEQARAMGHPEQKVHRVSGMILNPRFYEIPPLSEGERAAERKALGFDSAKPVGLVMFGGEGSAVMLQIARSLEDRQLILICGKNTKLRDKLKAMAHRAPLFVEGFTKEVPRYMQLADYFIGKPGPGSVSGRRDEAAGDRRENA